MIVPFIINEISLKNFRCFGSKQTARVAPLTFLVGDNSTGKTSFMAMIRPLLTAAAFQFDDIDFKEDPYDLGSFDDMVHRGPRPPGDSAVIEASFKASLASKGGDRQSDRVLRFSVAFGRSDPSPIPIRWRTQVGRTWVEYDADQDDGEFLVFGTCNATWRTRWPSIVVEGSDPGGGGGVPLVNRMIPFVLALGPEKQLDVVPVSGSRPPESEDWEELRQVFWPLLWSDVQSLFASAPVRSKPKRAYDPARPKHDPEGDYIPMYLARESLRASDDWKQTKKDLEVFGRSSGLFDEISIRRFGKTSSDPFQVQVRNRENGKLGPPRNLMDVGYGVSQVLPVIAELLRQDVANGTYLLQQPEVHLHPSAQAALGNLFCRVAAGGDQLIVETHSDYLLDRVRMLIRDGEAKIRPEDVSVLFFERRGPGVQIHSIQFDEHGYVLGAPDGYGQFFLEEVERSIGL